MSIEDVKNGGPASWYVGTDEAIRENRGDMGERGRHIDPWKFVELFDYEDTEVSGVPYGSAYVQMINVQDWSQNKKDRAIMFLDALSLFCPERLEK